jgi:hypothetical protein
MTVRRGCAASDVLAPLLDASVQLLQVASRSARAWQLADRSGRMVACVASPGAVSFPHAFVVPFDLPSDPSPAVAVGAGELRIDELRLWVARWWSPPQPRLGSLRDRIDDSAARSLLQTWRTRLGRGGGLTPYADAVLCGSLRALLAAGSPAGAELAYAVDAADLEGATTATSAGLLRQAARGRCIRELAAYLTSVATEGSDVPSARAALEALGHSSGRGMSEGVHLVLCPPVAGRRTRSAGGSRPSSGVAA